MAALDALDGELVLLIRNDADRTLVMATFQSGHSTERYCATHSMQTAVVCHLAGKLFAGWGDERLAQLRRAALTMNIGMADAQDQMSKLAVAPSPRQRAIIAAHEAEGVKLLRQLGVTDEDWLGAVGQHHAVGPGAAQGRPVAEQMARLIQRVDRMTAALSKRGDRGAANAQAAAKSIFNDENNAPDNFGATVIKAVGIYPPGSLVRLRNDEVAVVLKRGARADQPRVAAVLRADGLPHSQPRIRDSSKPDLAVAGALTQADIKLQLVLEGLLDLDC